MDFKTARRQTLLTALLLAAGAAAAQDYPARPIKLVIPYAAGGPTDTFGRAMADVWSQKLGTPVVIENRTGAGTLVGTEAVAKAAPDGYTLLLTTVAHAVNPYIHDKLGYRTEEDFAPVGLLARAPLVLVVDKRLPVQSLPDFLAYLRARPGQVSYASAGVGSAPHLGAELLNLMAGTRAQHVPYRGSAPAIQDLIGGHLAFMLDSAPTGLAQVKAGTVRLLATTMAQRLPQTPDTPAIAEQVPGYEAYTWNAVFAPAGTPPALIARLQSSLQATVDDVGLQKKAYDMGLVLEKQPRPQALATFLKQELDKWGKVARAAHMSAN